ncbi:hydrolase [Clostridia bacterium]|nr:hydrolase [Clostridia bacterium]
MIPEINGRLRNHMIRMPEEIWQVHGIKIFGKLIRAIVFSTDIAIIKNINADAVIAVYPFTAQPVINQAIIMAADIPVFIGVGGGVTGGQRAVNMAMQAEHQGARGVVLNMPIKNEVLKSIHEVVDIPIIVTVLSSDKDMIRERLESHVAILNVSVGAKTPQIVSEIKKKFPQAVIMATGGPTPESIKETIAAGADAITWTPPTTAQISKEMMKNYRSEYI